METVGYRRSAEGDLNLGSVVVLLTWEEVQVLLNCAVAASVTWKRAALKKNDIDQVKLADRALATGNALEAAYFEAKAKAKL